MLTILNTFTLSLANECIENFLDELQFSVTAKEIYSDMLATLKKETGANKISNFNVTKKIDLLKNRLSRFQDLLIDGVMSLNDYNCKNEQYQKDLNNQLRANTSNALELKSKIEKGINIMTNAREIYLKATVIEKQHLISSIFPEKK